MTGCVLRIKSAAKAGQTMQEQALTCGQELAASASVPEQFGVLFRHVAKNLRKHATWVGIGTDEALLEHDAMIAVAQAYYAISDAGERAATLMRSFATLQAAPHDPEAMNRDEFM